MPDSHSHCPPKLLSPSALLTLFGGLGASRGGRRFNCLRLILVKPRVARLIVVCLAMYLLAASNALPAQNAEPDSQPLDTNQTYVNRLTELTDAPPLLNDYPEFVQPLQERRRFEAPGLVHDANGTLSVRAWRFSYNARGIIEMPNLLDAAHTAVIMVHPWGIDDGQGWKTPEPAGVADFCTPEKNHLAGRHTREVIDPLLQRLRPSVGLILYSLPGSEDPIRRMLYRSVRATPSAQQRQAGQQALQQKLQAFDYQGESLPQEFRISQLTPVRDYFRQFPGLDATAKFNHEGFWDLPIPVTRDITVAPEDVVIYDADGYPPLRDFLKSHHIRHVLLTGYATDMCFCRTTAGYENLSQDFNVFLVGDATLATFPASDTPRYATNAHIAFASLNQLITQVSWIRTETSVEPPHVK